MKIRDFETLERRLSAIRLMLSCSELGADHHDRDGTWCIDEVLRDAAAYIEHVQLPTDVVERAAKAMAEANGFSWKNCAQEQWRADASIAVAFAPPQNEELIDD